MQSQPRPATPHPQLRKIKQIAIAQKFVRWAAGWYGGLVPESQLKVKVYVQSQPRLALRG